MKSFQRRILLLTLFVCGVCLLQAQTPALVTYYVDQSTTRHTLHSAHALPAGRTGVISFTGSSYVYTVVNHNGSVASSTNFTGHLQLQNAMEYTEMTAVSAGNGNLFIVYTSDSFSPAHTSNEARFIILSPTGALVASGAVNQTQAGGSLNRFFSLAKLSNGNVVAAWMLPDNQSGGYRIFSPSGAAISAEGKFAGPLSTIYNSGNLHRDINVAANPIGGFLITFVASSGGGMQGIRFNNSGAVEQTGGANTFAVDATSSFGSFTNAGVIGLANGNYQLSWFNVSTPYTKVISATGADVKARATVHPDLAFAASWQGWISSAPVKTAGGDGYVTATVEWQDYDNASNPRCKVVAYHFDLSGNFLSKNDMTPYFVADVYPVASLYSGQPYGVGVAYNFYKTFTPTADSYTVPTDADIAGLTSGFSQFALPVRLQDFTAKVQNDQTVLLQWTTAFEDDNKAFNILRSINGSEYQLVGTVAADKNATSGSVYNWTDLLPQPGVLSYRLVQVDLNGQSTQLGTRTVRIGKGNTASKLYPNPVTTGVLTLYAAAGNSHYTLFDAAGNQLRAGNISGGKVEMDISNLAPGVYFLYLNGGERLRFVKQ